MANIHTQVHQILAVMGDLFMVVAAGLVIWELVHQARTRNRHRLIELAVTLALAGIMVQNPFLPAQIVNALLHFLGVNVGAPQ